MSIQLKLQNIRKIYSNGDGVKDISFDIKQGELVSLLGPSGCGKTTVLRAIGGFNEIDSGLIEIAGVNVSGLPPEKRPTSMVFQSYNLWPHMSIYENLALGLKLRSIPREAIRHKVTQMMTLLHMEESHLDKYPDGLSGGQQQRIAIGRSLLLNPKVLLMDEPFSALDAKIRRNMREELKKIQRSLNVTIVFVTHDQEEALSISDRIIVMDTGSIEQIGTPDEIYNRPVSKFVAGFIGDMNFISKDGHEIAFRPEHVEIATHEPDFFGEVIAQMEFGPYSKLLLKNAKDQEISISFSKDKLPLIQGKSHIGINITTTTYTS